MKALSQSEYGLIRSLYQDVYSSDVAESILDEFTDEDLDDLTDEYIEEQVTEFFEECLEEGLDIDIVEQTICESIESSLELLSEDRYAAASAASKENAKKPEVKAANRREALKKVGAAVKKVGSAMKSGVKSAGKGAFRGAGYVSGAAGRAASSAKSEFSKGYNRGKYGKDEKSDASTSSSDSESSSTSSSSSSSGSTRRAVGKAARGVGSLLKKGLKKVIGGTARAVSRGTDKIAKRMDEEVDSLKEELEATGLFTVKEIAAIEEAIVKNEELKLDENRRAARAAGGYKDDSKKQTDPSKAGFTGISNSIADIMKQNKEIEARKKK